MPINKKEYMREYRIKNREKLNERTRQYFKDHPDYTKNYYNTHKEEIYATQRNWQKRNSKKFTKACQDSRRRRVEKLREDGCTNAWSVVTMGVEPKYKNKETK